MKVKYKYHKKWWQFWKSEKEVEMVEGQDYGVKNGQITFDVMPRKGDSITITYEYKQ